MRDKKTVLIEALKFRESEVFDHQINIDNYMRAIDRAKSDPDLVKFVEQLHGLLASSIIEQKKAGVMRDVIREQLDEMK